MRLKNMKKQRTIDSFAAHGLKESKKSSGLLSDAVINCIANNSEISLNKVKRLRKSQKY